MRTDNQHIGSGLDDVLNEDGSLEEVSAVAMKRVIAWRIAEAMKAEGVTKKVMADRMHTSRAQLDRVLDQEQPGLTFETLSKAAAALRYKVKIDLVPAA